MNDKNTKPTLFWTAIAGLSAGALVGCEYCIPAMLTLLAGNYIFRATRAAIESLQTQQHA